MKNSAIQTRTVDVARQAYSSAFYAGQMPGALQSARVILEILFETFRPASVLDVGCGQGAWLAAAEELGSVKLAGIDGPWVDPAALLSPKIEFSHANLEEGIKVSQQFDLCISVEVAEHLRDHRARAFVEALCAASEIVLFSAAVKGQGGTNHVNEQWQSYWAQLFDAAGYQHYDLFRPRVWMDRRVERWYRQNLLLYAKRSHPVSDLLKKGALIPGPLDIVHPEVYEDNLQSLKRILDRPSLKLCGQLVARWGRRQIEKGIWLRNKA